jgi:hypothetical protein
MIKTTDKSKTRALSAPEARDDPWADWQPQWHLKKTRKARAAARTESVHERQESHSPTTPVLLRDGTGGADAACRRRLTDARLWDALSPLQQDAAAEIAQAYETISRGIGYAISDWQRAPVQRGRGNAAMAQGRSIDAYAEWAQACRERGLSHSLIVDVLVFGFSCGALDRDRRARNGFCRDNLQEGLTLYAELQGWKSR